MSVPLTVNGVIFNYPVDFDNNWGVNATGWAQAVTSGMLQKAGGSFPLAADVDFGGSFGLIASTYKSRSSNIATTGFLRLAATDALVWRNNANTGNLPLAIDGSDHLTFNGSVLAATGVVNNGTQFQLGYYATTGDAISGLTLITPSRALQSDANGLPVASTVSATTLAFLDATSSVQTQLNARLPLAGGTLTGNLSLSGAAILNSNGAQAAPSYAFSAAPSDGMFHYILPTISASFANWNTTTHHITATNHNLPFDTAGQLTTTGTLPAGLFPATNYFVIWVDANTFALAANTSDSSSNIPVAFTTQGTGTHTFTPTYVEEVGISVGGTTACRVTPTTLFVGGTNGINVTPAQGTDVIHAERSTTGGGFNAVDVSVLNSGTGSARFIATSGGLPTGSGSPPTPNVQSYLIAYGATNGGTFWPGGPNFANAGSVTVTGASSTVFEGFGNGTDTHFWSDNSSAAWFFRHGAGVLDFSITPSAVTSVVQLIGKGTATNDNAAAGNIGDYISSAAQAVNAPASGNFGDVTSIVLTAGDWDVFGLIVASLHGATGCTVASMGISTTAGNSGAGLVYGDSIVDAPPPTGSYDTSGTIPAFRASLTGSTTYYLKMLAVYATGTPTFYGRITARRPR